jgi:hypothetical protein
VTQTVAPNGLPVVVVRHDGVGLEHEHADHLTYKFPVVAEYVEPPPPDLPAWDDSYAPATLALIYTDGVVALTLYEHCYDLWLLDDGRQLSGEPWFRDGWRLSRESRERVLAVSPRDGSGERGAEYTTSVAGDPRAVLTSPCGEDEPTETSPQ